ncbi:hypothetical protein DFQ26_009694 [Actinomortierella ambigua]|nr:hypothetical protein DFQ26_009694 [Actinomortierella ambigua]
MLPEVRDLLLGQFAGYVQFEIDRDTTKQHVIMPIIHNYPGFEELSDEALEEVYNIRIVQDPMQLDGDEKDHIRVNLIVANQTVATVITRMYDDLPATGLMMCMRFGLLEHRATFYTQKYTPAVDPDFPYFIRFEEDGIHIRRADASDEE